MIARRMDLASTSHPCLSSRRTGRSQALLLALAALAIILPGLGRRDISTSHEARVVQTARTMAESGWPWAADRVSVAAVEVAEVHGIKRLHAVTGAPPLQVNPWLIPVMNGRIRLQKPPLPYWAAAICFRLFGYGEGSARLPAAALGGLSALLVFGIGRRIFGRSAGWYSGLAWISLYFVYDENRKAMADPYLAFFSLLAIWMGIRAVEGGGLRSPAGDSVVAGASPRRPSIALLFFYLVLGIGTLAKGPFNLLHVGIALSAYYICIRRRPPGRWWQHLIGVGLLLAVALPWPAYVMRQIPDAIALWRYEADNDEKPRPFWFYVPGLFLIALPWTALLLLQIFRAFTARRRAWSSPRRRDDSTSEGHGVMSTSPHGTPKDDLVKIERHAPSPQRRTWPWLFPAIWLAIIVAIFSFSPVKKYAYLLPMMPAVALSAGLGMRRLLASLRNRRSRVWSRILIVLLIAVGGVFGAAMPYLILRVAGPPNRAWLIAATAVAVIIFAGLPALAAIRSPRRLWPVIQSLAFAVAIAVFFNYVNAPRDNRRSAKAASLQALRLLSEGGRTIATDKMSEEVAVYLPFDPYTAVKADARFASRVLLIWDDADGVELRHRGIAAKPFNPIGWMVEGGRVISFKRVPIESNPGDVRWQLWELKVERTLVAIAK